MTRALLVLLTWDDEANLRDCLRSLWTTDAPFWLTVIDNGSTDGTLDLLREYQARAELSAPEGPDGPCRQMSVRHRPGLSLAQALNVGFAEMDGLTGDYTPPYIGWIHPDMIFEQPEWLSELARVLDEHPEIVKLGAADPRCPGELRPGNSQCYLVRRTALEQVGLFDEGFGGVGGFEDWDANRRLLTVGDVMITPDALVRHIGMATRSRRDTSAEARANASYYFEKWRTWLPPV